MSLFAKILFLGKGEHIIFAVLAASMICQRLSWPECIFTELAGDVKAFQTTCFFVALNSIFSV